MSDKSQKAVHRRNVWCWLLSLVLAAVSLAVAWSVKDPLWAVDDDFVMSSIMSQGLPAGMYPVFINICLSALVAALYGALPSFPWWAACQVAVIVAGDVVLCHYMLQRLRGHRVACVAGLLMCQLVCVGCLSVNLQFTVTAGFACAVGLFFLLKDNPSRCECVSGICFVVAGFLVRADVGYVALAVLLGCAALRWLLKLAGRAGRGDGPARMRVQAGFYTSSFYASVGVTTALVIGAIVLNTWAYARADLQEYLAFNDARSAYTDFPHVTYGERPDVYDAVGWDADLAMLTNSFYSLDEAVTADGYRAISSANVLRPPVLPAKAELFLIVAVLPVVVLLGFVSQKCLAARVGVVLALLACYGCNALLLLMGRCPPRVIFAVVMVCFAAGMAHVCAPLHDDMRRVSRWRWLATRAMACLLFVVLAAGINVYLYRTWSYGEREQEQKSVQVVLDAYADAKAHPDDVFIVDTTVTNSRYRALDTVSYAARNVVFWGGWEYGSPECEQKLESLGIASNRGEALLRENCFFMTSGSLDAPPRNNLLGRLQTVSGRTVEVARERAYASGLSVYKYVAV